MAVKPLLLDETGKEIIAAILSTDVAQARIEEINTAADEKKQEVLDSIPEDYTNLANEVTNVKSDLSELENEVLIVSDNILSLEVLHENKYVSYLNGTLQTVSGCYATDYIELDATKQYKFGGSWLNNAQFALYDENKNFVIGLLKYTDLEGYELPSNTKYTRVTIDIRDLNTLMLLESTSTTTEFTPCGAYFLNYDKLKNIPSALKDITHTTVLTVGANKQFATIRSAFESILDNSPTNRYIVEFYGDGTEYDLTQELSESELSGGYIGLRVPEYTSFVGIGGKDKCILVMRLESENTTLSALNVYNNSNIEGFTIKSKNTRYTVHDDYYTVSSQEKTIKNCHFISEDNSYNICWGAGYRSGDIQHYENCIFETQGIQESAFTSHNNVGFTKCARLYFTNCRFINANGNQGISFQSITNNANGIINEIYFYGCKFDYLRLREQDSTNYGTGLLTKVSGYGNTLKTGDENIRLMNTDNVDYSSYVDLI